MRDYICTDATFRFKQWDHIWSLNLGGQSSTDAMVALLYRYLADYLDQYSLALSSKVRHLWTSSKLYATIDPLDTTKDRVNPALMLIANSEILPRLRTHYHRFP